MELLRLYQTVGWLAEGADPKDRGAGDALVALAADALMAARHLDRDRGAVTRRMLQARGHCGAIAVSNASKMFCRSSTTQAIAQLATNVATRKQGMALCENGRKCLEPKGTLLFVS